MKPTPHPFAYAELHSQDADRAKSFYRELFAWPMNDLATPMGPYTEIVPGEGIQGGLMQTEEAGAASFWMPYVQVPELDQAVARARALGATVLIDRHEIPEQGWLAMFVDPTGARCGMWQKMAG